MQYTILIVDDEPDLVRMLADHFSMLGYLTLTAGNYDEAVRQAERLPDLIVLDVSMPGKDGLEVCRAIRDFVPCPILFLTARVEDADKLRGFAAGGDDYVAKPFSIDELEARVAAHIRRETRAQRATRVHFSGDVTIDYGARAVFVRGEPLPLAKKEFEIVEFLSNHRGQVFDKERIYERLWGYESEGSSAVVAEHIKRIRSKLEKAGADRQIETIWGVGYRWKR